MTHPKPPQAAPRARGRWAGVRFALRAVEVRLRFVAILVAIGLFVGYWDVIRNYWDKWTRPAVAASMDSGTEFYCPMHPNVVRPTLNPNGSVPNCPICGMTLSKRRKGEAPELPAGVLSRVQLSPERVQLAGIETVGVEYQPLAKELRAVGYVDYDESRQSQIVTRVGGYVEKLYVDKTFVTVEPGDRLAEIYSPELYSAAQELLLVQKRNLKDMIQSSRQKLRLLGIGDREIDEILASGQADTRITVRSPQNGHVIGKEVVEGSRVEQGMTLFEVADLSVVWIEADVFEKDIPFLQVGQAIEARVESFPNRVFVGRVSLVHPHIDRATRTNRVRFEIENPEHELRPGMYATVLIKTPYSEIEPFESRIAERRSRPSPDDDAEFIAWQQNCPVTGQKLGSMGKPIKMTVEDQTVFLCCAACEDSLRESPEKYLSKLALPPEDAVMTIPRDSVIDTGTKQVVYVEREPGMFEGVEVVLGPRSGDFFPVISGLHPGDRVAAAGAFLIDAETRLNPAAASTYFGATGSPRNGSSGTGRSGGRSGGGEGAQPSADEPAQEYDVTATVTAIGSDLRSVTLDHNDIPGLMPAMKMKFGVTDSRVLEGIERGDRIRGRLSVKSGEYTITRLTRTKEDSNER